MPCPAIKTDDARSNFNRSRLWNSLPILNKLISPSRRTRAHHRPRPDHRSGRHADQSRRPSSQNGRGRHDQARERRSSDGRSRRIYARRSLSLPLGEMHGIGPSSEVIPLRMPMHIKVGPAAARPRVERPWHSPRHGNERRRSILEETYPVIGPPPDPLSAK